MNSNQITIASQDLARRLAQARGEIDYCAPPRVAEVGSTQQ